MKKEIIDISKKDNVFRVTSRDERWYVLPDTSATTGLPEYRFVPSVTWIAGHYPKGIAFYKWLAEKGWDEAEAAKQAAGDKGSKVHKAIEDLIAGKSIAMDAKYEGKNGNGPEELSVEEYEALLAFASWAEEMKPKFLEAEVFALSNEYGYAGMVDCIAEIDGETYIVDWKTSQYIWPEYELQVSAYKHALIEMGKATKDTQLAILQVGYRRNKKGFKWNPINDQFPLFLSTRNIWAKETDGEKPRQKDYPLSISLKKKK